MTLTPDIEAGVPPTFREYWRYLIDITSNLVSALALFYMYSTLLYIYGSIIKIIVIKINTQIFAFMDPMQEFTLFHNQSVGHSAALHFCDTGWI